MWFYSNHLFSPQTPLGRTWILTETLQMNSWSRLSEMLPSTKMILVCMRVWPQMKETCTTPNSRGTKSSTSTPMLTISHRVSNNCWLLRILYWEWIPSCFFWMSLHHRLTPCLSKKCFNQFSTRRTQTRYQWWWLLTDWRQQLNMQIKSLLWTKDKLLNLNTALSSSWTSQSSILTSTTLVNLGIILTMWLMMTGRVGRTIVTQCQVNLQAIHSLQAWFWHCLSTSRER